MPRPNKKIVHANILFNPGFTAPPAAVGNQATQYFYIEGSEDYTNFALQMLPNGSTAAIGAVFGSITPDRFASGVSGGNANDSLTLPANYQPIFDSLSGVALTHTSANVNIFTLPVQFRGGLVVRIDTINANGATLHITMGASPFVASL